MSEPTKKGRCPICCDPKEITLRKNGTMREHPARSGTRPCGGTGREPEPAQVTDPREWAVLDGLVDQGTGDDDA